MTETKADLKSAISDWSLRTLTDAQLNQIIKYAEGALNARIPAILKSDTSLTSTASSNTIDASALSPVEILEVFARYNSTEETELDQGSPANSQILSVGQPSEWWVENKTQLTFNRPFSGAYTIRVFFRQKLALHDGDDTATNWLLEDRPDLYLAACMVWSAQRVEDSEQLAIWRNLLREDIPKIRAALQRETVGNLNVDSALVNRG